MYDLRYWEVLAVFLQHHMAGSRIARPLFIYLRGPTSITPAFRPAFVANRNFPSRSLAKRGLCGTSSRMAADPNKMVEAPNGEKVPETELWKYRAPYRVHDKQEDFDVKCEGNCHCGKVKFQLSRDTPLASKLCHCTTCQTQHGTP